MSTTNPFANPFTTPSASPFAARVQAVAAADADAGPAAFAMVRTAPAVPTEEVEDQTRTAVEVVVSWGSTVLEVAHLEAGRSFWAGEASREHLPIDVLLPAEKLGTERLPVVLCEGGATFAVLPTGATGWVERAGEKREPLEAARAGGEPCAELRGAVKVPLAMGTTVTVELGGFSFRIGAVRAGKRTPRGALGADRGLLGSLAATFTTAAVLMGALVYTTPDMNLLGDDALSKEQMVLMAQFLSSAAEREEKQREVEDTQNAAAPETGGEAGERAKGDEGQAGKRESSSKSGHYAVQKRDESPQLSRHQAIEEAKTFGMIAVLTGDPNAPTAQFGGPISSGLDAVSAQGNMWGPTLGEAAGSGGLGLTGLGEGSGGVGEGIGLGSIGGLGDGLATGGPGGFGRSTTLPGGGHKPKAPRIRPDGTTVVSGRLPPEIIQRVVRQNHGRFRMCYEGGLSRNPNLAGRVAARFVIGRDGSVSNVSNGGSDLPDSGVVSCVIRSFYGLSFPAPTDGIVSVVYPISFNPG